MNHKDYEELNIFDLGSLLLRLIHDGDITFYVNVGDAFPFHIRDVNVKNGAVILEASSLRYTIVDSEAKNDK